MRKSSPDRICQFQPRYVSRLAIRIFALHLGLMIGPVAAGKQQDGGECRPAITASAQEDFIVVRPHENAFLDCTITQEQLQAMISDFLAQPGHRQRKFEVLSIGRLVYHPWLSRFLAKRALEHPEWDHEQGRTRSGHINQLVQKILSGPELLSQIQQGFGDSGYTVSGAEVEKILVTSAAAEAWLEIPEPGLVSYDAITYFTLKKN